jgi:hypothetical protein
MSPYNPNANWTAATAAGAQAPIYYIAIEGLTTKHFSTGPVRSAGTTKEVLLRVPDSTAQKLSQLQGRASLTVVSFELVDRDGEITDLVATEKSSPTLPTLVNRAVTLYSGYADLAEADYAPVGFGQIDSVEMTDQGLAFRFTLVDLHRHQFDDIFANAEAKQSTAYNSALSADASAGATQIAPVNVADLQEGDRLYLGPSTHASYTGQEEKVTVLKVSGSTVVLEAALTKSFKATDEVRWATTVVEGNPINLMYAILTGDFANGTFPLTKKRGEPTGLGIAASSIDTVALQKERDRAYDSEIWRFELKDGVPGFRFLEQRIYRLLGYPRVTIAGKLSFRLYRAAWPDDAAVGLPTITKGDVVSWSWRRAHELHVNEVSLGVDMDPETGEPAEMVVTEDTADQSATKEIAALEEEDTGLRASLRGVRLAEDIGAVIFRRFLKPPPLLELWCHLTKRALEVGEDVSVTHDEIPNVKTGTRGLTASRWEIVEREERFAKGQIRFVLQDGGYSRPAFIADDAEPPDDDYDLATAADKEYAYIAPDAGNFADGGEPYEIC